MIAFDTQRTAENHRVRRICYATLNGWKISVCKQETTFGPYIRKH